MGNTSSRSETISTPPADTKSDSISACPVDHAARQAWLDAASESKNAPLPPNHPKPGTVSATAPTTQNVSPYHPHPEKKRPLASDRVISSIPRASSSPETTTPSLSSSPSPNAQTSSPSTSSTGNWIYPSEKMFFDAMARKQHSPKVDDMAAVVPIHNAVNERAWYLIKQWEGRFTDPELNKRCGGPRLRSFQGDSRKLSPRARWLGLWGYERPFDRHDWVVERCPSGSGSVTRDGLEPTRGEEIEYVIDFYRGRESEKGGGRRGGLNFYLDVRPKLNSWEGWRMRFQRFWGL